MCIVEKARESVSSIVERVEGERPQMVMLTQKSHCSNALGSRSTLSTPVVRCERLENLLVAESRKSGPRDFVSRLRGRVIPCTTRLNRSKRTAYQGSQIMSFHFWGLIPPNWPPCSSLDVKIKPKLSSASSITTSWLNSCSSLVRDRTAFPSTQLRLCL